MSDPHKDEIEKNYRAFSARLPELLATHAGKFALMRDGAVIEFFDTARDAYVAGQKLYPDRLFSVQEIIGGPVSLGFLSYAVSQRTV